MTIVLDKICKSFGEKQVLQNFSCVLPERTWTVITGPSGSGKTTLFRILLGLEKVDSGSIQGLSGFHSAVFQENRLCEELTVEENIRLVHAKGLPDQEIDSALEELGIFENKKQPVSELSGGMKRRCTIARAALTEADLYLLDEPFYGLDEQIKEKTIDYLVKQLHQKTTVLITHDKEAIEYLKGRQIHIHEIELETIK